MQFLLPILLVGAAIGLFSLFINPTYQEIKGVQAEVAAYDEALNKAKELKAARDQLLSRRNTFPAQDVQKLERLLPDNVDNIRFVIDINNIAARRNLSLSDVQLGDVSDAKTERGALAIGASSDPVGSAQISFGLTATYEEFLAFLQDLEHSLRLVDVESIDFQSAEGGRHTFSLTIRTYWLR